MLEGATTGTETILNGKWKSWCRLCAKADAKYTNVFERKWLKELSTNGHSFQSDEDLATVILEFFQIHIQEDDKLPQIICQECHEVLRTLITFSQRANKVQQMYHDLQNSINESTTNLQMLLQKYGLYKDELLMPQIGMDLPVEEIFVAELEEPTISTILIKNDLDNLKLGTTEQQKEEEIPQIDDKDIESLDPIGADDKDFEHDSCTSAPEDGDGFGSDSDSSWMEESLSKLNDAKKEKDIVKEEQQQQSSTKVKNKKNKKNIVKNKTKLEYSCEICAKQFHRRCNLTVHMKNYHDVLRCRRCASTFKTEPELKQHMKELHRKLWNCSQCEQKFERKGLLTQHIKDDHTTKRKYTKFLGKVPEFEPIPIKKSFACEVCGEDMRTKKKLKLHLHTHAEYTFVCKECGQVLKTLDGYRRHLQIHGDNYVCPQCGKKLSSKATFNKHMLVHSDELKHKCDVCGRCFKRGRALKYHLIAHTGLRPYSCDFCGKTFSAGSSCRLHKKTMHPNELAELEASGKKTRVQHVPNLETLKAVARTGTNFRPLMSKQNGYAPRC